ncbi:MAG: TIGR04325 family methyltransferase [Lautropia sp.]|nr:TIGR04325 family methyltransferase [Lautropia sp.]
MIRIVKLLGRARKWVMHNGPLYWLETAWKRYQFIHARRAHLFQGVYASHAEAMAHAPATAPVSYDNEASARLYLERLYLDDYDHPALFWLSDAIHQGMGSIVDVGGAVGIKYFAFRPYIDYPSHLCWLVVDMPAVVEEGRRFAAERGAQDQLRFSERLQDADGMDVFYASGSLQYLEQSLPEILAAMHKPPKRIVINTTPIHERYEFFTLNSIGTAYCGYRVQAREPFVKALQDQGYCLRDQWRNLGKSMPVIGKPDHSIAHYSGFCFDQISGS